MSPSSVTYGTSNEHETDERVRELSDSLRELGYSKDDVRHHSKVFRRLSEGDHIDPQRFIAAMLEVDDEFSSEEETKKSQSSKEDERRPPPSLPPSPPKKSHSGLKTEDKPSSCNGISKDTDQLLQVRAHKRRPPSLPPSPPKKGLKTEDKPSSCNGISKDTLRELGFGKDEIRRHSDIYRRHSNNINAQQYISAMLEAEDDCCSPKEESTQYTTPSNMDPHLVNSLCEMGFEKRQVENVIRDMVKSKSKLDVDDILVVLMDGGGSIDKEESRRSSRSSRKEKSGRSSRKEKSRRKEKLIAAPHPSQAFEAKLRMP